MRKITITRRKSLRACVLPYFIVISAASKDRFMAEYGLSSDLCEIDRMGQAVSRIDRDTLNQIGIPILNGNTVSIDLTEDAASVFAVTMDGSLSNEIRLSELHSDNLVISTKGGWRTACYPVLEWQ